MVEDQDIVSPVSGQIIYDNGAGENVVKYYNGSTWVSLTGGTVTSVTSGNTNTITIGGTSIAPTVSANTAVVTNGSLNLATGDQIYDFVTGLGYTSNIGDITRVDITAGNGLSGNSVNTLSGDHVQVLTVGAGDGITVNASNVAITYSGANSVILDATDGTGITLASTDKFIIADDSDASDTVKYVNFSQLSTALGSYNFSVQADTDGGSGMPYLIASGDVLDIDGDGTQGITTEISDSGTTTTVLVKGINATTTTKGVASFNTNDFSVVSGAVSIKTGGVSNAQLVNDSITIGNSTIALGGPADTTLTGLTDIDLTAGNKTIFDGVGANTLTIGAASTTVTIAGNLVVTGTTTTEHVETLSTSNGIVFEGSVADANELTLLAGSLSADRTITLPDATGTVALTSDILATAAALIDVSAMGVNTVASFTHGLASKNLIVQMYDVTTGEVVYADIDHTSNNAISIIFAKTPTNDIRVVVIDAKNGLTDKTVSYS